MRRSTSLAVATAVLVLTACAGGGDPAPSTGSASSSSPPSTSSNTTPTTTASTTKGPADNYPPAARLNTVAGGKAFVEYYFTTLNQVYKSPQEGVIPKLAAKSCQFCERNEKRVSDLVDGGGRYASDAVKLAGLKAMPGAPKGQQYYSATSMQLGATILDKSGKAVNRDDQTSVPVSIAVIWSNGAWKLYGADKA